MKGRSLCLASVLGSLLAFVAGAQPLQLVSVIDPSGEVSAGGGGDSGLPIISADGRFVLFASTANNLVLSISNRPFPAVIPPPLNVFARDRFSNTTALVSVSPSGSEAGNGNSVPISISTNGQYVLFESSAGNLVADDTNNATDVFLRDLVGGVTWRVSVSTNGGSGNGTSRAAAMTPDGRFITFVSGASNLVANDTNGIPDVFVRDTQSNITALVSVGAKPRTAGTSNLALATEGVPEMTPDGWFVLFSSTATNLVSGVVALSTSGNELYLRDRLAGTNLWVSGGARSSALSVLGTSNVLYFNYLLSADAAFVVYQARKSNAYTGLTLRYNVSSGTTDVIHTNALVPGTGDNRTVQMTPDGRFVTFVASQGVGLGTNTYVLVWDGQFGSTTLVSGDLTNAVPLDATCDWPVTTPDGRFVAFLSSATNLVTNAVAGEFHLYLRDTLSATTVLVDGDTNGVGSSLLSSLPAPSLSADGRYVAFESVDGRLVAGDSNRRLDVFVRDARYATNELVSSHHPALTSNSANAPSGISGSSLSADGRYVAFASDADNLVAGDTNGYRDIYLRDLVAGTNVLVSRSTNGVSAGHGPSSTPSTSADGRKVAFSSRANDLVAGDTNGAQDVFVRDLETGITLLASIDPSGLFPGNKDSSAPVLNNDGSRVLFRSQALNLVPGTVGENLFLRDLTAPTTYGLTSNGVVAASMTPDGRYVAFIAGSGTSSAIYLWDFQTTSRIYSIMVGGAVDLALSPDGNRIAYWVTNSLWAADRLAQTNWMITALIEATRPGMRFSLDGRFLVYSAGVGPKTAIITNNQVWLYDFQIGTNFLVTQSSITSGPANDSSDSPDISGDGRFIAFRSAATDIVFGDNHSAPDVFLFDRTAAQIFLISASRFGNYSADNRSLNPVFSGDSQSLLFESLASDAAAGDFNASSDAFLWPLNSSGSLISFPVKITAAGQVCRLSWQIQPGRTYRVQFKHSLDDPSWQDLIGVIGVIGNTASFNDTSGVSEQRFYRVKAL